MTKIQLFSILDLKIIKIGQNGKKKMSNPEAAPIIA